MAPLLTSTISMSTPSSSFGALMAMATPMATSTEVKGTAWARQMWPQCNNITIHGPHSPQKPSSAIRMAMMRDMDSYYKAQRYSLITACICLALIAMTLVPGLIKRSRTRYPLRSKRFNDLPWGSHRAVAWLRRFAYRNCTISLRGKVLFSFAGAGHMSVIAAVCAGLISWCFAIQPHYRCTREWGCEYCLRSLGLLSHWRICSLSFSLLSCSSSACYPSGNDRQCSDSVYLCPGHKSQLSLPPHLHLSSTTASLSPMDGSASPLLWLCPWNPFSHPTLQRWRKRKLASILL